MKKDLYLGLDCSSIGYFVITDKNNCIVDVIQLPQSLNKFKDEIKEIEKEIKLLKPNLKEKGQVTKTKDKIAVLNRKRNEYLESEDKNVIEVLSWLKKYAERINICHIEKKLMQTANASTIQTFMKLSEYLGIAKILLDLSSIEYKVVSITDWRKNYNYRKLSKEDIAKIILNSKRKLKESEVKREFVKQESIRISEELIPNIREFYKPNNCKNINDDICESVLLSILGNKING